MVGETISHYRIVEKLGGGGMGVMANCSTSRNPRTLADLPRGEVQ